MTWMTVAATASAVALGGWFGGGIEGNGVVKEEARKVGAFSGVSVGGGVTADVQVGAEQKVTVIADENLLPHIKTKVENGVLSLDHSNLRPTKGIKLVVVTPTLDSVEASGGVRMKVAAAPSKKFNAEASGGSELEIRGLKTDALTVDFSGGVDAKLLGSATHANIELSGGVELDAKELQIENARLDASGGVDAQLHVTQALAGDASGGVTVKVKGKPSLNVDSSGASSVRTLE